MKDRGRERCLGEKRIIKKRFAKLESLDKHTEIIANHIEKLSLPIKAGIYCE